MFYCKECLSAVAIGLTVLGFLPYIRAIRRQTIKPHVFSWGIWSGSTAVVFFAQLAAGGGVGTWSIGVSGALSASVAILAWAKRGDRSITRSDWAFFLAALWSLPLWYISSDPLWAVVILTLVDLLGFGPTLRRVYREPYSESAWFFAIFAARNSIVVAALEAYSVTTVLFPAVIAAACLLLIAIIVARRRVMGPGGMHRAESGLVRGDMVM